jgi:hypothetical protein
VHSGPGNDAERAYSVKSGLPVVFIGLSLLLLGSACSADERAGDEAIAAQPGPQVDSAGDADEGVEGEPQMPSNEDRPLATPIPEDSAQPLTDHVREQLSTIEPNPNDPSNPEGALCFLFDEMVTVTFVDHMSSIDWDAWASRLAEESDDPSEPPSDASLSRESVDAIAAAAAEARPELLRLESAVLRDFATMLLGEADRLAVADDPTSDFLERIEPDDRTGEALEPLYRDGVCRIREIPEIDFDAVSIAD